MNQNKTLAIIGGGPAALFVLKNFRDDLPYSSIAVFEKSARLGAGMPYSEVGAKREHVTNVSDNEIPDLPQDLTDFVIKNPEVAQKYGIEVETFHEYKVVPRLLFGDYLECQFRILIDKLRSDGITVDIFLEHEVTDAAQSADGKITITCHDKPEMQCDAVIICTGHVWPKWNEQKVKGYFDSPYPPSKIASKVNHAVGIKGASLTAIDAVKTLAWQHGTFEEQNDKLHYRVSPDCRDFRIVMHSRSGLLPAVRIHLADTHLSVDQVLTKEQIESERARNDGFLPLDFVYEEIFLKTLRNKHPEYYESIKALSLEEYTEKVLEFREDADPFELFRAEFLEAENSIEKEKPIHWKEALATLSYAMNYPAKYFSAEDMVRLKKSLMPLISLIIAFVPQGSGRELMALHEAGILKLVAVGQDSEIVPGEEGASVTFSRNGNYFREEYKVFIDCTGQDYLPFSEFPFKGLLSSSKVVPAKLRYRDFSRGKSDMENMPEKVTRNGDAFYLTVPGLKINDNFQVCDELGNANEVIFVMAVPHIGGLNPDYSGLDFCETASRKVIEALGLVKA
ncbi:FAD/NAD(P)-binding protein [Flavobacterium sp.]|uniref:FAD/NAD(P)-binding protein n=1 Tax=Flavobacterium sp. TaxID=239 RepID=UPI0012285795|nr:FAD/NAD(P)-binding protein [Flavobacterium sp.]RZJ73049.1 MAG: hypothetical protein EOO49_05300 [Flavobacterium sp.]